LLCAPLNGAVTSGLLDRSMARTSPTRVLFVEDEPLLGELVTHALTHFGFDVMTVENAPAALRHVESRASVDLMFTDIVLPGTMDGAELAMRARHLRPEMPIIYASAYHSAAELDPLVPRSIFVPKPYNPLDLCALFNRIAPAL